MIKNIILVITILFTIMIFKNYEIINYNIFFACELFIKKIFPSLFPMFLISSILINLNFIKYINIFFGKITNFLFKINSNLSYIFFMSMISGFPSNAKIAKEMYDNNLVSKKNIQKILLFSHFSNPLFLISMIHTKTHLVFFAHFISNFIIGIITRNLYIDETVVVEKRSNKITPIIILFNSINNAISTLLFVLGTIVTFYIISSIINIPFFNIILELSQGLNYINTLNVIDKYKIILSGALISFGGICIHFQVYGILNELKIKYTPYLLARLAHSLITITIILIFY